MRIRRDEGIDNWLVPAETIKGPRKTFICRFCGEEFSPYDYGMKRIFLWAFHALCCSGEKLLSCILGPSKNEDTNTIDFFDDMTDPR